MMPKGQRFLFPFFKSAVCDNGGKAAVKASRSSVYLASSPEMAGVNGQYFDTNNKRADWPPTVMDADARQKLWEMVDEAIH